MHGALALIDGGKPATVLADAADFPGVLRAARDLQGDLSAVAGSNTTLSTDAKAAAATAIIVGTLGHSARVDRIVREKHIDVGDVAGRWEAYLLQVVEHPEPGIARALLIAGADKRGTIFGIYELSRRLGVSPWTWWADVPVPKHAALHRRARTLRRCTRRALPRHLHQRRGSGARRLGEGDLRRCRTTNSTRAYSN